MPPNLLVPALSLTLVISWGSLYYAFTLIARPLEQALGWSPDAVMGAFSLALLVWGLATYPVAVALQRWGGRCVMTAGSLLAALLWLALAQVSSLAGLYAVWAGFGVAMAMTLYEPAFAVIVQTHPGRQRRPIATLTLAGGLASTVFWPLTHGLVGAVGWRHTALVYAGVHLLVCAPLHAAVLPRVSRPPVAAPATDAALDAAVPWRSGAFRLLATSFTAFGFITAAVAIEVIPLLESCGLGTAAAVALAACIGPMQVAGRAADLIAGTRISPQRVGAITVALMPFGLAALWFALCFVQWAPWLCGAFVVAYGTSLGLLTVVRAAAPLALFGPHRYARVSGALGAPSLVARAAGPLGVAWLPVALGSRGGLLLALLGIAVLGSWTYLRAAALPQAA